MASIKSFNGSIIIYYSNDLHLLIISSILFLFCFIIALLKIKFEPIDVSAPILNNITEIANQENEYLIIVRSR